MRVAGRGYIATRLRAAPAERAYDLAAHQQKIRDQQELVVTQRKQKGSVTAYAANKQPPKDTFSIFGVPVYRSQNYFVYIPQFNNEYTVPGVNLSPNPDDTTTLLVTINRGRYQGTTLRPVFPDLVYNAEQHVDSNLEAEKADDRNLVVFGAAIKSKQTYYVTVPEMRTEYVVFGDKITPYDSNTVKVVVNGVSLVGTAVRPAWIRNNHQPGDKDCTGYRQDRDKQPVVEQTDNKEEDGEKEPRYTVVAFGVPINPDTFYEVHIPDLEGAAVVQGCDIAINTDDSATVLCQIHGQWHVGKSIKHADSEEVPSDTGETYQLGGIVTAFGLPVLPHEKYAVFVPALRSECIVFGRHIHTNTADDTTVTVIISGLQFEGTSVRAAASPICPRYPVGTVISSTDRRYRYAGSGG